MLRMSDEAGVWLTRALEGVLVLMGVSFALEGDWVLVVSTLVALVVSLSPVALKRDLHVHTPWVLNLLITVSLVLHLGGLYTRAYEWFPFYDSILHFAVSGLVAFLALLFVYTMERYWDGFGWVSRPVLTIIIFLTTVAAGALWEMMEFASDVLIGTEHQHGNFDTMKDLILDGAAGLIVALLGAPAIRRGWLEPWRDEIGPGVRRAQQEQTQGERRKEEGPHR